MESYKGNLFTIKACYRRSQNGSTATDSQSIMNGNLTFENTFLYFSKLRGIQLIYLMKKTYLILHYKFLEDRMQNGLGTCRSAYYIYIYTNYIFNSECIIF